MKMLKAFLSLLVLALLMLTALFIDFTYKTFSARPRILEADAIVVLAGGKGRIEEGIRLFREKRANKLFLIGVDPVVRKSELYHQKPGDPTPDNVILEKSSRNTLENAIYARDLLVENKVNSILLITSRYHLKRASILFRNTLPTEINIYPYPVDTGNLKTDWWYNPGSFKLLFSEFYKYCLFRAFFIFSSGEIQPSRH